MWYKSSCAGIWSARLLADRSCRLDLITLWSQRDKLMVIMLTPGCVKDAHYSESCVEAIWAGGNERVQSQMDAELQNPGSNEKMRLF